jgi:hypothetical protein
MSQPGLQRKLLQELDLWDTEWRAAPTPITEEYAEGQRRDTDAEFDQTRYQRIVGMLIYLCHSRPDILFAVSTLSSRSNSPCYTDFEAAVRVGRYLRSTADIKLRFSAQGPIVLYGYADASFAGHQDGRSQSGNSIHLAPNSAPIAASSRKQSIVALSSTEAELESLKNEATLTAWMLGLLGELGYEQGEPVRIYEDNQSAISLVNNPGSGNWGRTRHFTVRYNYIKSLVEDHKIQLVYIPTKEQLADIFTKALPSQQFASLRNEIMG